MHDIAREVLPIVEMLGPMLRAFHGSVDELKRKDDDRRSVVTRLDQNVERYLNRRLTELDRSIKFVGEEFGGNRDAERFWLCDPIDGTTQYIEGVDGCTTMVALIEEGEVVFSTIYDFPNYAMYYAEKGKGAFCNKYPIRVNRSTILATREWEELAAEVASDKKEFKVGFESDLTKNPSHAQKRDSLAALASVFKTGNAGHELTRVARGSLSGRICLDPFGRDYDFAAGAFLVKEAGGVVANIGSKNYDYRNLNFIAANPALYLQLTEGPSALFPVS